MTIIYRPNSTRGLRRCALGALVASLFLIFVAGIWQWWGGRAERSLERATHHLERREPDEALSWLEFPEATPATRDRALVLRARWALERGRPAEAVQPLDAIDARGPQAADAAFWKGRTLYEVRQYVKAIAWFQQALALRPDHVEAHRWVAAAAYDLGARDLAFSSLEAALRLDPDHAPTWRTLALMSKEQVEWNRARDAYETALRFDSSLPRVHFELAEVLKVLGRFADAERHLVACKGDVPEADRLDLLAECLHEQGDRERLRALLESALARYRDHPGLLASRGMLALADGRPAEAILDLDRGLKAKPFESKWLYQKSLALQRLGRTDEARRELERCNALKGDEGRMSDLENEAARDLGDPEVRVRIAELCARLGRHEMAASWYRAALACDPENHAAHTGLVSLRAR